MIENKLYQAANLLPKPASNFSQIERRSYLTSKKTTLGLRSFRRVAVALLCIFLLTGGTVVAATTEVNYSAWANHSDSFDDAEKNAQSLGVVIPETLDDSPFFNITTMYVAPKGTTYLDALNTPAYRWYSIDYGIQDVIREYDFDSPNSGFSENPVIYDEYSLSIGSTNNELYRYIFSLDETGVRDQTETIPGSYRVEEYNGITMQIMTDTQFIENSGNVFVYHHRIVWVDKDNQTVFSLHKAFYAEEEHADQLPGEMIDFAKEIVDSNIAS